MDIKTLKLFIDVVKNKSINRAAQLNYRSASSVSRAMKSLEEETKTKLMTKNFSGVSLTNQGKEFYGMVEPIVQSIDMLEWIYCSRESRHNTLRLTICVHQNSVAYQSVLNFYEKYAEGKEYVDIVVAGYTSLMEVISAMQDRFYMMGVVQYNNTQCEEVADLLKSNNLMMLHENTRKVYASVKAGHPLSEKKIVSPEDLLPYTHLAFIDEEVVPLNYGGDLTGFDSSQNKRRILVRERGQLDEILRATDAYFLGTGDKNIDMLKDSGVVCVPVKTDLKIMTALICRMDYIMTESAQKYCDIMMQLFEQTD